MDLYPVRMAAAHAIIARELGEGNLADGVRLALEKIANEKRQERRRGPPDRRTKKSKY